mmetsp:Transcript_30574/g.71814  ORF Transcript_30574/g.71814 Transcript_30574/m.71814 type:complete len:96 (-) Transcript_30574:245-532(-)
MWSCARALGKHRLLVAPFKDGINKFHSVTWMIHLDRSDGFSPDASPAKRPKQPAGTFPRLCGTNFAASKLVPIPKIDAVHLHIKRMDKLMAQEFV